jgi:hypothetical protein
VPSHLHNRPQSLPARQHRYANSPAFIGHSDPNLIQLIEPTLGSCGQYAALSYCWGKGASLTATKHTLPSLRSGFALATLPQTIQDAITVSRKLRIKHIWVDAL